MNTIRYADLYDGGHEYIEQYVWLICVVQCNV